MIYSWINQHTAVWIAIQQTCYSEKYIQNRQGKILCGATTEAIYPRVTVQTHEPWRKIFLEIIQREKIQLAGLPSQGKIYALRDLLNAHSSEYKSHRFSMSPHYLLYWALRGRLRGTCEVIIRGESFRRVAALGSYERKWDVRIADGDAGPQPLSLPINVRCKTTTLTGLPTSSDQS